VSKPKRKEKKGGMGGSVFFYSPPWNEGKVGREKRGGNRAFCLLGRKGGEGEGEGGRWSGCSSFPRLSRGKEGGERGGEIFGDREVSGR